MKILVTGCDGYLGSLLTPELQKRGNEVIGLDIGFYKERMLYRGSSTTPLTIVKDLRRVEARVDDVHGQHDAAARHPDLPGQWQLDEQRITAPRRVRGRRGIRPANRHGPAVRRGDDRGPGAP